MEDKRSDALYDEQFDLEWELYGKLRTLIDASWDSNTLKHQIESLLIQYEKVRNEICDLDCPHKDNNKL